MSDSRIFGSSIQLFFSANGTDLTERLAEVDSFSAKHNDIVKKNSSLGEGGTGTIQILDDGGTMSFEAKMSSAKLEAFMVSQSFQAIGGHVAGSNGKTPYLKVIKKVKYDDGSFLTTVYEGVVLHNYEESVGSRTDEIVQKVEAEYKYRTVEATAGIGNKAGESAKDGYDMATLAITQIAQMAANITANYIEIGNVVNHPALDTTYLTGI